MLDSGAGRAAEQRSILQKRLAILIDGSYRISGFDH